MNKSKRGQWSSRTGFIFATAGSAIGLGNIWKFPAKVGAGGGGAYILIYFMIVFTIGISVMLVELTLGRKTQRNTIGAFLSINGKWSIIGYLGVLAGFIVLSYYCVIGGYILRYILVYLSGGIFTDTPSSFYHSFISNPWQPILFGFVFLLITGFIVMRGIAGGIERANKIMMPVLMVLLIAVMLHSLRMPGAHDGVKFLTTVDFSEISGATLLSALGQALFSLSIGLGTTCTYGSYLKKSDDLISSAFAICILDTLVALTAAFTIIPAVFSVGLSLNTGGSFAFIALPQVFSEMSGGAFYGMLFYLLLTFAALTSAIALLEGVVAHLTEDRHLSRKKAVIFACAGIGAVSAVYSLSAGALPFKGVWYTFSDGIIFPPFGQMLELITDNLLIPVGSFGFCLFVGRIWGAKNAVKEIRLSNKFSPPLSSIWTVTVRYIAPLAICIIFLLGFTGSIQT